MAPDFANNAEFNTLPARALPRYIVRWVLPALITAIPITALVPFGYLSMLMVVIAIGYGILRYKDAGWSVWENTLVLRSRTFARNTVIIPVNRIQSTEMRRSWLQKGKALANFRAFVASGLLGTSFGIADAEEQSIKNLLNLPCRK